jgi:hypothetical protein
VRTASKEKGSESGRTPLPRAGRRMVCLQPSTGEQPLHAHTKELLWSRARPSRLQGEARPEIECQRAVRSATSDPYLLDLSFVPATMTMLNGFPM